MTKTKNGLRIQPVGEGCPEFRASLREFLEDPETIQWLPLSALKAGEHLSCVDGRHSTCIVAGPGGDLGEFVTLVTAIEEQQGPTPLDQLEQWLLLVMDSHSTFYKHTDEQSLIGLGRDLAQLPLGHHGGERLADATHVLNLVRHPPPGLEESILELVAKPSNCGCGHLRFLIEDPASYGVRPALPVEALKSFFRLIWGGSPSGEYVVLGGEHVEEALIHVEMSDSDGPSEPADGLYVAAVRTDGRVFVNHEQARSFLRHQNLMLLAGAGLLNDGLIEDRVLEVARRLGDHGLRRTVANLGGAPEYIATFEH